MFFYAIVIINIMTAAKPDRDPSINLSTPPALVGGESETSDFIVRMKEIFDFTRTMSDSLRETYATDPEAFKEALDDTAEEAASKSPNFQAILNELKKARCVGADEAPYVNKLKEMLENIKKIIISEAGLPDEALFSKIEQAKLDVAASLLEANQGIPVTQPIQALEMLGIMAKGDEGNYSYSFPYNHMPDSVVEKWKIYLAAACEHMQLQDAAVKTGETGLVAQADKTRKYAHDSVTRDVHVVLGLDGLGGWGSADTRKLLGACRDYELPTHNSAVDQAAQELVSKFINGINVACTLSQSAKH